MKLFYWKLVLLSFLLFAKMGQAVAEDPNFALVSPAVKNICRQVAHISIHSVDAGADLAKTLDNCDAADFYYGIQHPRDFAKARQCAYLKKDFSTLTMIYANGKGVPRNWDLAIHFACQAGFAPAEIEARVLHLVQLRDQQATATDFDICDDVTSGYMMGVCTARQEQLTQAQRRHQLDALMVNWNTADKAAFLQLQQAANAFFTVRSANEVDLSGTARAALEIEEQASLRDDFLTALQQLTTGKFPLYTPQQVVQLDQQLNAVYQQIENNRDFSVGTIDRAGVQKTQRSWLKYREAWVEFGKVKYPQVNAQTWRAWMTEKRIQMLQDLAA